MVKTKMATVYPMISEVVDRSEAICGMEGRKHDEVTAAVRDQGSDYHVSGLGGKVA